VTFAPRRSFGDLAPLGLIRPDSTEPGAISERRMPLRALFESRPRPENA
jgi:hypothetical protein